MFFSHNYFFMNADNPNINRDLLLVTNVWRTVQCYGKIFQLLYLPHNLTSNLFRQLLNQIILYSMAQIMVTVFVIKKRLTCSFITGSNFFHLFNLTLKVVIAFTVQFIHCSVECSISFS
jgi:hypothetical protein